jgi:glutamine synthetase
VTGSSQANPEAILATVAERDVTAVRFGFCDAAGVSRCKAIHARRLEQKLSEGVSLSRAQMAMSMLDELVYVEEMQPVGEIRLMPDPDSFVVLPWAPRNAAMLCDQVSETEQGWAFCPRSTLRRVVERLGERGITVKAAFETEFYVVQPDPESPIGYRALPKAPVYSSIGHDTFDALMHAIVAGLEAQGIEVEQAINEYGPGQLEFSIGPGDPISAADDFLRVRDTARAYTAQEGYAASFAPKPFPSEIGSGEHIHLSFWGPDGENLLHDPAAEGQLSDTGRRLVAGLLEHLPALVALTAPSYNSYRRFEAGMWASSTTSWGYDNREAAVRVSSPFRGREAASFNVELKPADSTANPYLSLAAVLLAGLDGIERALTPPPPAATDPARLPEDERQSLALRALPTAMSEALDNLDADEVLREGLGSGLLDAYLVVRRHEAERFAAEDEEFELRRHFNVY